MTTDTSLELLQQLAQIPEFNAGLAFYVRLPGFGLLLGYCGYFCWPAVHRRFDQLGQEQLLDCLRLAAYCTKLTVEDDRHYSVEFSAFGQSFKELSHLRAMPFGPERASCLASLNSQAGNFGENHPFRTLGFSQIRFCDESKYILHWIASSEDLIAKYMENERFCAGLEAMGEELLSFHGFLDHVFGVEYCDTILKPVRYALFPDRLRFDLTGRVILELSKEVSSGRRLIPAGLREKFPDIYTFYMPEAFGVRT